MTNTKHISIPLDYIEEGLVLIIDSRKENTLFEVSDAEEHGEARYQLLEGCFYDFTLLNKSTEKEVPYTFLKSDLIIPHSRKAYLGIIAPNIYVGTLNLPIVHSITKAKYPPVLLEVQSVKSDYRTDYRDMLEFITERCTELLMQMDSPVTQYFEPDFTRDSRTIYQKFSFIKSIIQSGEFNEAVHRIVSNPVTKWKEESEKKDIRNFRKFTSQNIREMMSGSNRIRIPEHHHLVEAGITSLPVKISSGRKIDCVDTAENRFIKHALEVFLKFCTDINKAPKASRQLKEESDILVKNLENHLSHSIFKAISRPATLKLNSPVLQRKEGYREILRVWLLFDLAARLVWKGGDDVYDAGKKDIAVLYEYWLFFKLLELLKQIFHVEPKSLDVLIKKDENDFNLQIRQGNHIALEGIYLHAGRNLRVRFSYNRSFNGEKDYPEAGSWTTTMRPDYTLTIWPAGIGEIQAEKEELIVHIHFDAKYKVENFQEIVQQKSEDLLDTEKTDNRKGLYKNADLLKMHAYKDAIRRTGGAYVLYPGDQPVEKKGFHEIIPGLGAFPVRPSKTDDGTTELKDFILRVVSHFVNRASQREKIAFRTYDIFKEKPGNEVKELIPETIGENRSLIPDETFVMVGFYKKENWNWILKTGVYNARAGSDRGSLRLGPGEAGAKYLLLHTHSETTTEKLLKIIETGPRIFSKQTLIKKGYPTTPSQDYYLVYKVAPVTDKEFAGKKWDITKLEKYKAGRGSGLPFAVSLSELILCGYKRT